jgi:hypothetical protein
MTNGEIRTRIFCSSGRCDDHSASSLGNNWACFWKQNKYRLSAHSYAEWKNLKNQLNIVDSVGRGSKMFFFHYAEVCAHIPLLCQNDPCPSTENFIFTLLAAPLFPPTTTSHPLNRSSRLWRHHRRSASQGFGPRSGDPIEGAQAGRPPYPLQHRRRRRVPSRTKPFAAGSGALRNQGSILQSSISAENFTDN